MDQSPQSPATAPLYYVGIGASAGGLEALEAFFSHLSPDTGMAFIVVQHLSPDYKSMMVELLSKRTEIPVRRAEDGMRVETNHLYLIPPRKNMKIFHGKLLLEDQDPSRGVNLPIDIFLRSLAEDQNEKSIGIILSGTGSDGVRGVRAIKEASGMVMVQSEDSARFDGMPRAAISTGLADFVLRPEEMPKKLLAFSRHPYATKSDNPQILLSDEDGLTRIFALLRERSKVDFTFYKPSTVVRRIERRMTVNQIEDVREYVRFLETHPSEATLLYKELLINVTSFFRDREVFDEISEKHLPALFANTQKKEFRFWVAGCSSGEEAYSLAILCREVMERLERRVEVKIFATDIDREAIVQAGNGLYPESIAADLSPKYLTKYFQKKDDFYRVDRSIREMVVFAQHNLLKDPPFTYIDLLSCRNLLIYFQPVLQRGVLENFNFSLNPDGVLVLGSSETVGEMVDHFEVLQPKLKIYASKGKRRLPAHRELAGNPEIPPRGLYAISRWQGKTQRVSEEDRISERFLQSLAGDYVPLALVVNERNEILHVLGSPEDYFGLPTGKIQNDVVKMAAKDLAIPLATGLQKVFKANEPVKYTNIKINTRRETKVVDLLIRPLPGRKGQEPLAALFIEEIVSKPQEKDGQPTQIYDASQEAEQRIHDLEQELQFTRENLQATVEELETSNEELQATNEELLASNEELQSTNEELQSVNEELHTVNTEFQSKIVELTEANNDLENLLTGTRVAILFADENFEIRRFSPEMAQIFTVTQKDIGRPLFHLQHSLLDLNLDKVVQEVKVTLQERELEVQAQSGAWFLLRVRPYRIGAGGYSGIALTLVDISNRKKAQAALQKSETQYRLLFAKIVSAFALHQIICDPQGHPVNYKFLAVNPAFERITGLKAEDLIGKTVLEVMPHTENLWIERYGKVALEGETIGFEQFSAVLNKTFEVQAYQAEPGTFAVLFRDVSERRRAEIALQNSESHYRGLFETMSEGVVYQNAEGKITFANPAAQKILGLTLDQMQGRTSFDPTWKALREDGAELPGDQHPSMVALHTGTPVHGFIMGVQNSSRQEHRWILVNAIPLLNKTTGKTDQVYTTFQDMTEFYLANKASKTP
jgi:two-component system CheB/CheR fusion protein